MQKARRILIRSLFVILLFGMPWIMTLSYYRFLINLIMIYALIAIGLNILVGYMGLASLGHAGLVAIAAYTSALVSKYLSQSPFLVYSGLHVWMGMLCAPILSCVIAILLGYVSLQVKGPYFSMVTIAFGVIVHSVLVEWYPVSGGPLGITAIPRASFAGVKLTSQWFYYVVLIALVWGMWLQKNLLYSYLGRAFSAIGQSEMGADAVGINISGTKITAFVFSAFFAGMGGALFTHEMTYISPDSFAFYSSVFFLLIVIFGGKGSLWGPVIGALCLTLLPEFLQRFEKYRLIIYGSMIIGTLYFLPNGLYGAYREFRRKVTRQTTPEPLETMWDSAKTGHISLPHIAPHREQRTLTVKSISKYFGGVKALIDVDMEIIPGTIHALIGPNGAGKTTLLNLIAGVYSPTQGHIWYGNVDISLFKPALINRMGIARTFQNLQLFPDMTVLHNVITGLHQHRQSTLWDALIHTQCWAKDEERFAQVGRAILAFIDLEPWKDTKATNLPYGRQKRLEIARALASNPSLLLLDEPAAGLNAQEIAELSALILKIREHGISIILVEHHMDLVMDISDTIAVLDYGVKIAEGTPVHIQSNQKVIEAYLGSAV